MPPLWCPWNPRRGPCRSVFGQVAPPPTLPTSLGKPLRPSKHCGVTLLTPSFLFGLCQITNYNKPRKHQGQHLSQGRHSTRHRAAHTTGTTRSSTHPNHTWLHSARSIGPAPPQPTHAGWSPPGCVRGPLNGLMVTRIGTEELLELRRLAQSCTKSAAPASKRR